MPKDLSVVGFDDTPLAAHVHPALTTARADVFEWGRAATEALGALTSGRTQPDVACPPAELILRESTGPPRQPQAPAKGASKTSATNPSATSKQGSRK